MARTSEERRSGGGKKKNHAEAEMRQRGWSAASARSLIAAEMDSTLQVLTEWDTSGTWPPKKRANNSSGLKWCLRLSPADEGDVQAGVNEIERGRGLL